MDYHVGVWNKREESPNIDSGYSRATRKTSIDCEYSHMEDLSSGADEDPFKSFPNKATRNPDIRLHSSVNKSFSHDYSSSSLCTLMTDSGIFVGRESKHHDVLKAEVHRTQPCVNVDHSYQFTLNTDPPPSPAPSIKECVSQTDEYGLFYGYRTIPCGTEHINHQHTENISSLNSRTSFINSESCSHSSPSSINYCSELETQLDSDVEMEEILSHVREQISNLRQCSYSVFPNEKFLLPDTMNKASRTEFIEKITNDMHILVEARRLIDAKLNILNDLYERILIGQSSSSLPADSCVKVEHVTRSSESDYQIDYHRHSSTP